MEMMKFNLGSFRVAEGEERERENRAEVINTGRWTGYCLTVMEKRNTMRWSSSSRGEKLLRLRHDINGSISTWANKLG